MDTLRLAGEAGGDFDSGECVLMLYALAVVFLPPLLVFTVYHFMLSAGWVHFGEWKLWRRVAFASGLTHLLLLVCVLILAWLDHQNTRALPGGFPTLGAYMSDSEGLRVVAWLGDPIPSVMLLGVLTVLEVAGVRGAVVPLVVGILYLAVGTLQWYWIGGGLAAAFERLWQALRRPGDDLPDWF